MPARELRDGSVGEDGVLAVIGRPFAASSRMTSVKVPPVSTPITALGRGYDTAQSSLSR